MINRSPHTILKNEKSGERSLFHFLVWCGVWVSSLHLRLYLGNGANLFCCCNSAPHVMRHYCCQWKTNFTPNQTVQISTLLQYINRSIRSESIAVFHCIVLYTVHGAQHHATYCRKDEHLPPYSWSSKISRYAGAETKINSSCKLFKLIVRNRHEKKASADGL